MPFNKIVFIVCFCCFFSCNKTEETSPLSTTHQVADLVKISKDSLQLMPNKGLVFYQNEPFTGRSIAYYEPHKIAASIAYLAGKKHGLYQKWFEDGLLSFEANYKEGKQDELTKTWWSNGNLRSESRYREGIPHGLQMQWYKSGAKFKQLHLNQGIEDGMQQSWRENGKIYNNYEAKNGRIFGLKRANLCYELEDEKIQFKE